MKKKILQPNVIIGYDDKGKMITYYWQKEPIKTRRGGFPAFIIPWYKWWNPIWRFNQRRLMRKPLKFGTGFMEVNRYDR